MFVEFTIRSDYIVHNNDGNNDVHKSDKSLMIFTGTDKTEEWFNYKSLSSISPSQYQWTVEKAKIWYNQNVKAQILGCNYIPGNAINQLEHWQSYNTIIIDHELSLASSIGMNTIRVYLHYLLYDNNTDDILEKIDNFLSIATNHNIKCIFVLFDDCWNSISNIGKQPEPILGVHNSGWLQCPDNAARLDPTKISIFENYVHGIVNHFANDTRIIMWDVWNEPGNSGYGNDTLSLLSLAVNWIRQINPIQPITIGFWKDFQELNHFQYHNADILSFHYYHKPDKMTQKIKELYTLANGRPILCTEYMARTVHSTFQNTIPLLFEHDIGAISWGLVSGKTNTIYKWGSQPINTQQYDIDEANNNNNQTNNNVNNIINDNNNNNNNSNSSLIHSFNWKLFNQTNNNQAYSIMEFYKEYNIDRKYEPNVWFHDIFRTDGTPYDKEEIIFLKRISKSYTAKRKTKTNG
eukprot:gene15530-20966_t